MYPLQDEVRKLEHSPEIVVLGLVMKSMFHKGAQSFSG